MSIFLEGFLLQASLIFALGAQNIYVLESGLHKQHQHAVSIVCFLCDLFIIMIGVMGTGKVFNDHPGIKVIFGILGIVFLFHYGLNKMTTRENEIFSSDVVYGQRSFFSAILKAMTFSLLNPHAYLDGIILIGGYSSKYPQLMQRMTFGFGAAVYSLVWFLMLSGASARMKPFFSNQKRMKYAMSLAGFVLVILSAKLSVDVYGWVDELIRNDAIAELHAKH